MTDIVIMIRVIRAEMTTTEETAEVASQTGSGVDPTVAGNTRAQALLTLVVGAPRRPCVVQVTSTAIVDLATMNGTRRAKRESLVRIDTDIPTSEALESLQI